MILTVGNTKGGVGKTTIALNVAIVRVRKKGDARMLQLARPIAPRFNQNATVPSSLGFLRTAS
jgi:cellulose biosynthesis protein BcsQ